MPGVDLLPRTTARKARRIRLAELFTQNRGAYETPALVPCVISGLADRATATAYSVDNFVKQGNMVLRCIKAGTSSGSATLVLTDHRAVADNTATWAVFGYLAPVAFTNSLALVLGQQFAANGLLFEVTVAGTTHASDAAPSVPSGGTHGTVTYAYVGKQTLPLVTIDTSASGGTSLQAAWNSANLSVKGGSALQQGANARARVVCASRDGGAYTTTNAVDGGGGSWMYQTDANLFSLAYFNRDYGSYHWVDGKLAAFTYISSSATDRYIIFDARNLPRTTRRMRHKVDCQLQVYGVYATSADTIRAWEGYSPMRGVVMIDSFSDSTRHWASIAGDMLGIEDWRVSGLGSTGLLDTDTNRVNYRSRFTQDVISQVAPTGVANPPSAVVLICLSQNDTTSTASAVAAELTSEINRVRGETKAEPIVMGVWNSSTALTSGTAYDIDVACEAVCTALSVPYVKWRDLINANNDDYYQETSGPHPTEPYGHQFRAAYAVPRLASALQALAV